ncbi:MAG TPA: hypothetical protein VM934_07895 [Pyrinomonadaceae bacterium]|nr:hypothetical protein [Pyrinomonadaceae bacterium]
MSDDRSLCFSHSRRAENFPGSEYHNPHPKAFDDRPRDLKAQM